MKLSSSISCLFFIFLTAVKVFNAQKNTGDHMPPEFKTVAVSAANPNAMVVPHEIKKPTSIPNRDYPTAATPAYKYSTKKPTNMKYTTANPANRYSRQPANNKYRTEKPANEHSTSKPANIKYPTKQRTHAPTHAPTYSPSVTPTHEPTILPSITPTQTPSFTPTSFCNCHTYNITYGPVIINACYNQSKPNEYFGVYLISDTNFTTNLIIRNPNFPLTSTSSSCGSYDNVVSSSGNYYLTYYGLLFSTVPGIFYDIYYGSSGVAAVKCSPSVSFLKATYVSSTTCLGKL
jgi:hypothetical protein